MKIGSAMSMSKYHICILALWNNPTDVSVIAKSLLHVHESCQLNPKKMSTLVHKKVYLKIDDEKINI